MRTAKSPPASERLAERKRVLVAAHVDFASSAVRRARARGVDRGACDLIHWLLSSPLHVWLPEAVPLVRRFAYTNSPEERKRVLESDVLEERAIVSLAREADGPFWRKFRVMRELGRADDEWEQDPAVAQARRKSKPGRAPTLLTAAISVFDAVLEWGNARDSGDRRRLAYECGYTAVRAMPGTEPGTRLRGADAARYVRDVVKDGRRIQETRFDVACRAWAGWRERDPASYEPTNVTPAEAILLLKLTAEANLQDTVAALRGSVPELRRCHRSDGRAHLVIHVFAAEGALDDVARRARAVKGAASVELIPLTREMFVRRGPESGLLPNSGIP